MKLVRYRTADGPRWGMVEGDRVAEIRGDVLDRWERTGASRPLAELALLAPCWPTKIVAIGLNYRAHAAEAGLPVGLALSLPAADSYVTSGTSAEERLTTIEPMPDGPEVDVIVELREPPLLERRQPRQPAAAKIDSLLALCHPEPRRRRRTFSGARERVLRCAQDDT